MTGQTVVKKANGDEQKLQNEENVEEPMRDDGEKRKNTGAKMANQGKCEALYAPRPTNI